ncbi:alpha/beta fold hydrolase [Kitasatospora sp. NPDC052896]|uniref:alpha/beta fold hydrolase n=1 Tax=Kitasatospora sp. NPDC052896 TaxID=3364061 RepID=UPI0037CCB71B
MTPPADWVLPTPAERLRVRSADGSWLNAEAFGPVDAPTVLLAHGWTCSIGFWSPVIHRLADDHRVVAYDQRGHGGSDIPPTVRGYSTRALADDLEAVLTRVVPAGGRAVLAGHSMGGMTIMAAGGRPAVAARTAAALLVSTGAGGLTEEVRLIPAAVRPPRLRAWLTRRILSSPLPLGPVTGPGKAVLKHATMGRATPPEPVEACARIVHACPTAVRARWADVLGELDVRTGLAAMTAPTAVVVGSADRLTPPVHAHRMLAAAQAPAGLLELPGVGHMAPAERPAEIAAEIRRLVTAHLAPERTEAG